MYRRYECFQLSWTFKLKCFPNGLIKKLKAHLCARENQQIKDIDLFETYALVAKWIIIYIILMLEVLLELKSKQEDITAAFIHVNLDKGVNEFVYMPLGLVKKAKHWSSWRLSMVYTSPSCSLEVTCWRTGSLQNVSVQTRSMFIHFRTDNMHFLCWWIAILV